MEKFSYLQRGNLEYIEQQYQAFLQNPEQVDSDWRLFFEGIEFAQKLSAPTQSTSTGPISDKEIHAYDLIRYYRDYGHLIANLDPLAMTAVDDSQFKPQAFGLNDSDLDAPFSVASQLMNLPGESIREIVSFLKQTYCGTITAQLAECEPEVRSWFHKEFESNSPSFSLSSENKKDIFHSLVKTESLEKFIHTRYVGTKRFSVEGGDALLPMLEHSVSRGTQLGAEEIVIGMAHRGRINVLANFMDKALDLIFAEFDGTVKDNGKYDGDVKYHMGYSTDKQTPSGNCHVSLAFNPSHLEAVNPVVLGMTRAKQRIHNDTPERKKVIPLLIHGDAAVIGQGVTSETFQLSQLKGYTVGGSIHIIINNQVGFTTDPKDSRSTRYSSDIAKTIKAPVILVNGDDAEACVRAMDMAMRFRQQTGSDVVIDLICYRRYGHNEGDEPAFTQPQMYKIIKKHPTLMAKYKQQLVGEQVITGDEAESLYREKIDNLQEILDQTRKTPPEVKPMAFAGLWKGLRSGDASDFEQPVDTSVDKKVLDEVAEALTTEPTQIKVHSKIKKLIGSRKAMVEKDSIDWGLAELLSYGCLRAEGTPIRISGQDCKRGTFTHRQSVYFDSETGEEFCPLKSINPGHGEFCVYNSSLSEMAVLGFEYGNSSTDPTFLTIWEAQFGDFANGAQIIIDQFLSSGEQKWSRLNGLTLFLPHGYEGQGPEHSSARLERFLQLCAQENMQVCNLTTPANLFHILRRQMKRDFRKPLIIMTPKSLLRHPKVVSTVEELASGPFRDVIEDPQATDPKKVEVVAICSGKVYYDLDKAREETDKDTSKLAIVRMEQLYPFPKNGLAPNLSGFPKLKRVLWVQEEPHNMGANYYVRPKIQQLLEELGINKVEIEYIGRTERASPATGSPKAHAKEQQQIIDEVLQTLI